MATRLTSEQGRKTCIKTATFLHCQIIASQSTDQEEIPVYVLMLFNHLYPYPEFKVQCNAMA